MLAALNKGLSSSQPDFLCASHRCLEEAAQQPQLLVAKEHWLPKARPQLCLFENSGRQTFLQLRPPQPEEEQHSRWPTMGRVVTGTEGQCPA